MSEHSFPFAVLGPQRPSRWAVAGFAASCAFTAGALLLLLVTWAI